MLIGIFKFYLNYSEISGTKNNEKLVGVGDLSMSEYYRIKIEHPEIFEN